MLNNNYNLCPLYESVDDQFYRSYDSSTGGIFVGLNKVPSLFWKIPRAASLHRFWIVKPNGQAQNVTALTAELGVEIINPLNKDYSVLRASGKDRLQQSLFTEGKYHIKLELNNGDYVRYSECFFMYQHEDEFVELEISHNRELCTSYADFDYSNDFTQTINLQSKVQNPEYEYEEKSTNRNGQVFRKHQISKKLHRVPIVCPEFAMDFYRLIQLHDNVTLRYKGKEYNIEEALLTDIEVSVGTFDFLKAQFEFYSDSVVSEHSQAVTEAVISVPEGGCLYAQHFAECVIKSGSNEYTQGYYEDINGTNINFESGDRIILDDGTQFFLKSWNGSAFVNSSVSIGEIVYARREGFYFAQGLLEMRGARLVTVDNNIARGQAVLGTTIEIWATTTTGSQIIAVGNAQRFQDSGIPYPNLNGATGIFIKVSNPLCGTFESHEDEVESLYIPFVVDVQGKYPSDNDAARSGVLDNQYYALSINNIYGMPENSIKKLNPIQTYFDDGQAIASFSRQNILYPVGQPNPYGLPLGAIKLAYTVSDSYPNEIAAEAAGRVDYALLSKGNTHGSPEGILLKIYA